MHKKKKLLILIFLLIIFFGILIFLSKLSINEISKKISALKCTESVLNFSKNNSSVVFSIDKIVYFSSADCTSNINQNSSFTINNLQQYTDIAIFINNHSNRRIYCEKHFKKSDIN